MVKMDCGTKPRIVSSGKQPHTSISVSVLHSFPMEVVFILSLPSARSAPVLSIEIRKKIARAKNTSQCKEVCLLLPGELLSSLQLIIQHFPGSGPRYDAKTVGRRLNKFLLFTLRQCVCACMHLSG